MKISLKQVQENIDSIANRDTYTEDVIYELLAAYGRSKSAITQLREGQNNKAKDNRAVLQKDVVYFRTFNAGTSLEEEVEKLYEDPLTQRYKPRYIIATDLTLLTAKDRIKGTNLAIKIADIDDHLDFFYWWTGDEVVDTKTEAVADRRAADKMNELYVEIEKQNGEAFASNPRFRHELNVFFTRLLFCFFAEDTNIYEDGQFTNSIKTYTQTDGSDLAWFFSELFTSLDTEDKTELKTPFKEFPYVNGSIFNTTKHAIAIPKFSAQARHLILECGRQNWGEINPDIFGVMFQGVVDPEHRDENGMDYTSVPNIMKVIQPLFLDSLQEEFDKHYDNEKKLWALLNRVRNIKVFDPACGSGNFLIIAYKEMRQLQHAIIGRINELKPAGLGNGIPDNQLINIHNFYGIEIDDFAHELAVLSLFLAKHQMNQEFTQQFGKSLSIIPLIDIPTIVRDNAARLDWQKVCPNMPHSLNPAEQLQMGLEIDDLEPAQQQVLLTEFTYDEIYLIGNPPYKGSKLQSDEQKADFKAYFKDEAYSKNLDYISIWFIKGARYISGTKAQLAFVTTNSVNQGEHVGLIFPKLFEENLEIGFAYTSFKWKNSARDNAGVTVAIISLRNKLETDKYIFTEGVKTTVKNSINGYLLDSNNFTYINRRTKPLNPDMPAMDFGNIALDSGHLIFTDLEKETFIEKEPRSEQYFKKLTGAKEMLYDEKRYCLWLVGIPPEVIREIPLINERVELVRAERLKAKDKGANRLAGRAQEFRDTKNPARYIGIPVTTGERRDYIPIDFIDDGSIPAVTIQQIANGELWHFALLSGRMHMAWTRAIAGRLKTDYRYSKDVVYNNFPIQILSTDLKDELNKSARRILLSRAAHPEKTLARMYDPDKMPADLREAHEENDRLVDELYRKGGFSSDEDRLIALFDLYKQMTAKEKTK